MALLIPTYLNRHHMEEWISEGGLTVFRIRMDL
jgi:hypothetical protein